MSATDSRTFKAGMLASGQTLSACVGLVTYVVLSHVLSPEDYATYRKTLFAFAFAAPLLMLGLPQALYYFLPDERERARGVLLENVILLALMGAVFSLFLLLGGNRLLAWRFSNLALERTLLMLAPYPLFVLPAAAVSACLMARGRAWELAIYNVFSRLLALVLVVGACLVWRTTVAAIIGVIAAAAIALFPALALMFRCTRDSESLVTPAGMWEQLRYSVPLGLAGMIGTISWAVDKFIVASMCSNEDFAIYANGAIEIPLISIVTGSVAVVLLPDLARFYKGGECGEAVALWRRGAAKCALIIFPAMCVLFFLAPEIMTVLFPKKVAGAAGEIAFYRASAIPFRFYLLVLPIRIVTFGSMLKAAGRGSLILAASVGAVVVNAILSVVLVGYMGYKGAALGTVLMMYLWTAPFYLLVIARVYGTRLRDLLPYGALARIMAACVACSLLFVAKRYLAEAWGDLACVVVLGPAYAGVVLVLFVRMRLVDWVALRRSVARMLSRGRPKG